MIEATATKANILEVMDVIQAELEVNPVLLITVKSANTGKWGMAQLWRVMMGKTAEFMAGRGVTMPLMNGVDGKPFGERAFNAEDAHLLFTHLHGGVDKDGLRLSWSKAGRDGMRPATKAERYMMIEKHLAWAAERGLTLLVPRGSEFDELKKKAES